MVSCIRKLSTNLISGYFNSDKIECLLTIFNNYERITSSTHNKYVNYTYTHTCIHTYIIGDSMKFKSMYIICNYLIYTNKKKIFNILKSSERTWCVLERQIFFFSKPYQVRYNLCQNKDKSLSCFNCSEQKNVNFEKMRKWQGWAS